MVKKNQPWSVCVCACIRLHRCLEAHQSLDQTGFQTGTGLFLNSLFGKCLEWNVPVWFASLGLTNIFDWSQRRRRQRVLVFIFSRSVRDNVFVQLFGMVSGPGETHSPGKVDAE